MFGEEATVTIPKMKRAEVTPPLIEELKKKTPRLHFIVKGSKVSEKQQNTNL